MTQIIKTISLGIGLLAAGLLHAQTDFSNTGILGVNPGTTVFVTGSFNNEAGANFINRGLFHVKQGLTNAQPAMTPGTGTLILTGTATQVLSGTHPVSTFNLFTGNAAGILLNTDLEVSGLHTFTSGVVTTSDAPHYLVYEDGASYTGYTDARHVKGWVRKTGSANFTFPLGNGAVERPLAISDLSGLSIFSAKYASPTINTGSIASPLAVVDLNEYWIVNKISGGTASVDLYWDNSKVAMPAYILPEIRVAGFIGGNWISLGGAASGNIATTGTIHSNAVSVFGPITFGSISVALPVTIMQFTAAAGNGGNIVNWTTADEINVSHYDLQRSDDGIIFYSIGNVPARNGTGVQLYQFTDNKPMQQPIVYYRLRSVDKDGQTKMSKIISVRSGDNGQGMLYAINPAHSRIDLQVQRTSGTFRYKINTLSGQTIQSGGLNIGLPGRYSIQLLPSIAKGIYILQVEKPGFVFTQRLLID
ncbi:MAG: T9SS type A sorting domain-containing protein [Chitinophagaceae bacterium]